jgi:hypothetical protein
MEAMQVWQNIVLPFAAAGFGGWIAAQFALGRFRKEKVWERKTVAYTTIFDALYDMSRWFDAHSEAEQNGGELSEQRSNELGDEYRKARDMMLRRIASETWLLPEACINRITVMMAELSNMSEEWGNVVSDGSVAVSSATSDFRALVRSEFEVISVLGHQDFPFSISFR